MPWDKGAGKRRKTTLNERVRIIKLHSLGMSFPQIEAETGVSQAQDYRIYRRWKIYGDINPQTPRTGRPPKLNEHDKRYLAQLSDAHPRATAREVLHESRLDVGVSTLSHYQRSLQRWLFLARRKPWIGPHNRRQRKRWCRLRRKWEISVWRKHCYTDDVYLQIATGMSYRRKVRRLPGPNAAYDLKNLQPTFVEESIMVGFWAGFTYGFHTPLVPMRKRTQDERKSDRDRLGFNSHQYVHEILIPHLRPLYKKASGAEASVQTIEDSASYHTSIYMEKYRKHLGTERAFLLT